MFAVCVCVGGGGVIVAAAAADPKWPLISPGRESATEKLPVVKS